MTRMQPIALAIRKIGLATALAIGLACGGGGGIATSTTSPPTTEQGILTWLQANPAIAQAEDVTSRVDPYGGRFIYHIWFKQSLDHNAPSSETFLQEVTLRYAAKAAPVVMCSTGYGGFEGSNDSSEVTSLVQGNEITTGHRFFPGAVPDTLDWSKLDVRQAAADEHTVIQALKPLFTGRWISTGASKGGLAALFHRRFYPGDVTATVAYVAPFWNSCQDSRVPDYIDTLGTPEIRSAIKAWQQAILDHRSEVLTLLETDAANQGETFDLMGADRSLEFAVLEAPFTIWQQKTATFAALTPSSGASPSDLYAFLNAVYQGYGSNGVAQAFGDASLRFYEPYSQQCANQLGYPMERGSGLTGILYPGEDTPANYPPSGVSKVYDGGAAIQDLQTWLSTSATNTMLVYGQNDPCTAAAAEIGSGATTRGMYKFIAPGGNHSSRIWGLSTSDESAAKQVLSRWAGHTP